MKSLMIMYAKMVPEEKLLDDLQEALTAYKIAKTDETKNKLLLFVMMTAGRYGTEGQTIVETVTEMEGIEKAKQIHDKLTPHS